MTENKTQLSDTSDEFKIFFKKFPGQGIFSPILKIIIIEIFKMFSQRGFLFHKFMRYRYYFQVTEK